MAIAPPTRTRCGCHRQSAHRHGNRGLRRGDTLNSIENLNGSTHNDFLIGNNDDNILGGLSGNDTLKGGGGADTLYGDGGDDMLKGGGGADTLNMAKSASTRSRAAAALTCWTVAPPPSTSAPDSDWASYVDFPAGVTVLLLTDDASGGDAQGDELINIENLAGSAHADTLWGDDNVNALTGNGGNDELKGPLASLRHATGRRTATTHSSAAAATTP